MQKEKIAVDGKRLRQRAEDRGVTITQLAAACGISVQTFYNKLNGTTDWTVREFVAIANVLGFSRHQAMELINF